jgi:hypothetical protein
MSRYETLSQSALALWPFQVLFNLYLVEQVAGLHILYPSTE